MWIHKLTEFESSSAGMMTGSEARFYRSLAENSLGLMCCHDPDGVLLWINPAAASSLGYSPEEGIGMRLDSFLAPETRPLFNVYLARIRANGVDSGIMRLMTRHGDHRIWMYRNILSDDPELPTHILGHALDITERFQAEKELRDLNAQLEARIAERTAELERSNADLREFAYVASHDLQAPLKQVRTALETLGTKSRKTEAMELLRESQAQIERMSLLIESLLNYALVSSEAKAPARCVPLRTAVEESLMNLASIVTASNASVIYEGLPEVLVEEAAVVQLFQNLIGNAIKYRSNQTPKIQISAEAQGEFWICTVQDNGIGIDQAYTEKIFQAFSRLHGKECPGSGIGLAICRRIVERMGGRIWVDSQPGHGSAFRFTIPM
jgi:PAS domain S-box-containing protein